MSERVTVYLDKDEWYPVWSAREEPDAYGDAVEVDRETLERWADAEHAFTKAQDEMHEVAKGAGLA